MIAPPTLTEGDVVRVYANGNLLAPNQFTYVASQFPPVQLHSVRVRVGGRISVIVRDKHGVEQYQGEFQRYTQHGSVLWRQARGNLYHPRRSDEQIKRQQDRMAALQAERRAKEALESAKRKEAELKLQEQMRAHAKLRREQEDARRKREKLARKRATWDF